MHGITIGVDFVLVINLVQFVHVYLPVLVCLDNVVFDRW